MMRGLLRHLRSQLVGFLALLVALSGTSYAAFALPANSVTSREVKDSSLLRRDFRRGQVPVGARGPAGAEGAQGPTGAQGAAGSKGPTGDRGADAASTLVGFVDAPSMTSGFAGPLGATTTLDVEQNVSQLSAHATTVASGLNVRTSAAPTGGHLTVTLRANNGDTPVTCTVTAPATTCNSGAFEATIGPGLPISVAMTNTGSDSVNVSFSWRSLMP